MIRYFFALILLFSSSLIYGQTYHTPSHIKFAGMDLRLSEALRKEIQAEVDALSRSPKYLNIKLDRAKLYFPIIERIFREENLPDEFKYLVLQESALIADAVSTSNAVGFWQFKKESAEEVGLKIDGTVDERMNIVSSSRGAARYLKKNNFYYDNWVYALLAYYAGRGGAEKMVDKKYFGSKTMHLDKNLHWYIKKFLAHKVVFENALRDYPSPDIFLYEYNYASNKTLKEVARDFSVTEDEMFSYNKWLKRDRPPLDKEYTIIVPLKAGARPDLYATSGAPAEKQKESVNHRIKTIEQKDESTKFPEIEEFEGFNAYHVKINGREGVIARKETDNVSTLAVIGNISSDKFRKYNDLRNSQEVLTGHAYYLQPKKNKAKVHHHVLQHHEDLWQVSQKYGVKLQKLLQKNRISKPEEAKPGMVLWLRFIRPKNQPVEFKPLETPKEELKATNTKAITAPVVTESRPVASVPAAVEKPVQSAQQETIPQPASTKINKPLEGNLSQTQNNETEDFPINESYAEKISSGTGIHTVDPGETLYSISRMYQISITQLMKWNQLTYDDAIKIGQELIVDQKMILPESDDQFTQNNSKSYIFHKVTVGETLYKIARQYNVTIQEIMEWNNKSDFKVSVGENLRVSQ